MLPLELIVNNLHRYWNCTGALRMESSDCQTVGHDYCAEGAIADIFIKHAPDEAAAVKAHWDFGNAFVWEEDGVEKKETMFMPVPVMRWIDSWHGVGTADKLRLALAHLNDKTDWSNEQIAELIKIHFGLGDTFAEAKAEAKKVYAEAIKRGVEKGCTHGHS